MFLLSRTIVLCSLVAATALSCISAVPQTANTRNVILVMSDGVRWQEVFRGADETLLTPKNYWDSRPVETLKKDFLASTPEARRAQLFPFLWGTVATRGRLYGDLDEGSDAHVTNPYNFSYPGYSETLTGHADVNINSNDNKPNPNITVFEWLNQQPSLHGKAAAFGAWEVFTGIFNAARCGFPVNVSYDPLVLTPSTSAIDLLNDQKANAPRVWPDEAFDAPIFSTALEYLKLKQPRVMFLSLGETDDWAHGGNYGEYLLSAHRVDADLAKLWSTLQSLPQYRDNTTLIFLTDHGRGSSAESWKNHGQKIPESKNIFIGLLGPGVQPAGLEKNTAPVTQSQVAATIAKLLGFDWNAREPLAGKPLDLGR
ncbi:sulfatase-like hydrolase/transferase [Granulicella sibirica]|uniref:Sulfatase N-terminal domain-containing protein n=1 Tax=Granulicella sibirica TaxID=2479048 RepID=A0A4Q0T8H2_9BACT|nr:sulfatase-like hydrolase/transferase [Granulicella sibirica]RXH57911.1 hypothetical protein GRAN_1221 [Granulicella sibirica]